MKFKVQLIDSKDPSRNTEDETYAASEQEMLGLYAVMNPGFKVKVLEKTSENIPGTPPNTAMKGSAPFAAAMNINAPQQDQQQAPPPPPPPKVEFSDQGISYKIENEKVFKKEWVTTKEADVRIMIKKAEGQLVEPDESYAETFIIQKLQWVALNKEEKNKEEKKA